MQQPASLTDSEVTKLTQEYKQNGTSVWNKETIKQALREISNGKCCYCEAKITEESKYMEVEHFFCKTDFPDMVVAWENLLPACKKCNVAKGDHNVVTEGEIIDPTKDDPRQHIYLWNYRLKEKDAKGKNTIDVVDLNNSQRLVRVRFRIGDSIQASLSELLNRVSHINTIKIHAKTRNRIVGGVKNLLREAQPNTAYSATAATTLLNSPDFQLLKDWLIERSLWDDEMKALEFTARKTVL